VIERNSEPLSVKTEQRNGHGRRKSMERPTPKTVLTVEDDDALAEVMTLGLSLVEHL
jgi:hypothetical protein